MMIGKKIITFVSFACFFALFLSSVGLPQASAIPPSDYAVNGTDPEGDVELSGYEYNDNEIEALKEAADITSFSVRSGTFMYVDLTVAGDIHMGLQDREGNEYYTYSYYVYFGTDPENPYSDDDTFFSDWRLMYKCTPNYVEFELTHFDSGENFNLGDSITTTVDNETVYVYDTNNVTTSGTHTLQLQFPKSMITDRDTVDKWEVYARVRITDSTEYYPGQDTSIWYDDKTEQFSASSSPTPTEEEDETLVVTLDCPADLLITDSSGKRLGYVNGELYTEIAGGVQLSDDGEKEEYKVIGGKTYLQGLAYKVTGKETGTYDMTIARISASGTSTMSATGIEIAKDEVNRFDLDWDKVDSSQDGAVELRIDETGDGTYDKIATSSTGTVTNADKAAATAIPAETSGGALAILAALIIILLVAVVIFFIMRNKKMGSGQQYQQPAQQYQPPAPAQQPYQSPPQQSPPPQQQPPPPPPPYQPPPPSPPPGY